MHGHTRSAQASACTRQLQLVSSIQLMHHQVPGDLLFLTSYHKNSWVLLLFQRGSLMEFAAVQRLSIELTCPSLGITSPLLAAHLAVCSACWPRSAATNFAGVCYVLLNSCRLVQPCMLELAASAELTLL